jgi:hypothetical protein
MKLFEDMNRTSETYQSYSEGSCAYLSKSVLPEHERMRALLEQWFSDYPANHQPRLRGNFRSEKMRSHSGAFFELYCHALLRTQGFAVEVEPVGDISKDTHIDFLAYLGGTPCFYLEATITRGDETTDGSHVWLDKLCDSLNDLVSPNFRIHMDITHIPPPSSQMPPTANMRKYVEKQLAERDPRQLLIQMQSQGLHSIPLHPWSKGGWTMVLSLEPILPEHRHSTVKGTLASISYPAQWAYEVEELPLLKSLKKKATKYGNLDHPYVIAIDAVNTVSWSSLKDVLIKQKFFEHRRGVSAVLVVSGLVTRAVACETPFLLHNPWAEKPMKQDIWQGPQMMLQDMETMQWSFGDGKKGWEMCQLHPEWPRKE